jgi:DNA polymerase-3 subunit alpha
MAAERENFGFYFVGHPTEPYRSVASANGARSYASLMESGVAGGGRQPAVVAALVEGVSKGRTRRGAAFIRADFSDSSGQFSAACFEESLVDSFQRWAEEGTCVLLNVELDAPSPEEPPRITIRGARPLAEVRNTARMLLTLDVHTPEALQELRLALSEGEEGRGEVLARLRIGEGADPVMRLGRDFDLDGELAERLAHIEGLANVSLTARRGQTHLKLVA